MSKIDARVDAFIKQSKTWQEEAKKLRAIALDCQLDEDLKWGKPCYAFQGGNVVIIQGFKEYIALLFFKGALLKDAKEILVRPGENSQSGRQIRFNDAVEIAKLQSTVKSYIKEAIELEKSGAKVELKKTADYNVPEEFQAKLDEKPALRKSFEKLTPGRQRAYLLYFSAAKQTATRASRVDKCIALILKGKGLNDD